MLKKRSNESIKHLCYNENLMNQSYFEQYLNDTVK